LSNKKKVIIIGGAGFIGTHIVSELSKSGWQVYAVDRAIFSQGQRRKVHYQIMELPDSSFARLLKEVKPAWLIFSAGSPFVRQSIKNPYGDFSQSTHTYFWVLDQLRLFSPNTKVIFLSSAAVYGNPPSLPVNENTPLNPITPYGYHKLLCEKVSEEFKNLYNINTVNFRIFSVFGPGLRRQVIWDIVTKFLSPTGKQVILFGTGQESRDFLSIEDVAVSIRLALESPDPLPLSINLGSGEEITITELANNVNYILGISKTIHFSGTEDKGMPTRWKADVSQLKSLGLYYYSDFDRKLKNTVEWIREDMKIQN